MPNILDTFNCDVFSMTSLIAAIEKLPFRPSRIGQMGLFEEKNINTCTAVVEEKHGHLMLLPTAARGTMKTFNKQPKRTARAFPVPHIPKNDAIRADDLKGLRAFGSEDQLQGVIQEMNDRLAVIRQEHELTWEYHRIGAIKGQVLDADGQSEIYNWYDEFNLAQTVQTISLSETATGCPVKKLFGQIRRKIEDNLGMTPYTRLHAFVGSEFMDKVSCSDEFCKSFDRFQNGTALRDSQARNQFEYAKITLEEYRGEIGGIPFIEPNCAYVFPLGVRGMFCRVNAPGTFIEAVNTRARRLYVKQVRDKWDTCIEVHTQSNPLFMNTRPSAVCKIVCE